MGGASLESRFAGSGLSAITREGRQSGSEKSGRLATALAQRNPGLSPLGLHSPRSDRAPLGYYDVLQTARPKSKPKVVPALLAPPAKEAMPCEAKPVLPKCKGEPEKARPVTAKPPSPGGQAPAKGLEPPHTPRKPPEKVQKILEKPPVKAPEKFLQKPPEKAFEKPPEKPAEKPVETEEPKQASLIIDIDEGEVKATAKEPARKVRPLPKPVAVSSAINLEACVRASE
ncbi:unnamed protein product [Effrenium voratum]|nr:unnamed protein product [Effrenium voratum]